MLESRQEQLLTLVVEHYIKTAEPIGSRFLVEKAGLDWSEATVRNELRALEETGFLTHPHTSAGRIPTLEGYKHYLSTITWAEFHADRNESSALEKAKQKEGEYSVVCKNIAKELVELSKEAIIVAFSADKIYYTGLANLFQKPDFGEIRLVASVSQVFDRCEELLPRFYNFVRNEPKYFLGKEHPFGEMLSVLSMRFGKEDESLMALLGPQRMDYKRNWGLMQKAKELI